MELNEEQKKILTIIRSAPYCQATFLYIHPELHKVPVLYHLTVLEVCGLIRTFWVMTNSRTFFTYRLTTEGNAYLAKKELI